MKIEVEFPDGPQLVEAEYDSGDVFRSINHRNDREIARLRPCYMSSWNFYETIGGRWIAVRKLQE